MNVHTSAVVCAWCNKTVIQAPVGTPPTQMICQECADWAFAHQPVEFGGLADADHIDLPPRETVNVTKH